MGSLIWPTLHSVNTGAKKRPIPPVNFLGPNRLNMRFILFYLSIVESNRSINTAIVIFEKQHSML